MKRPTIDLDALLDALESMPAAQRHGWLVRHCPDLELRREALTVLAGEAEAQGYLEHLAALVDQRAPKRPEPPGMKGRRIGTWRLGGLLGRGGMGSVYQAERDDGTYTHRVALKLLNTALTDTEAYQRFLGERKILAELDHPAIARIVDGGVTEDGTPWFAMERVEGLPIDAYCDRHELGIDARLELFLQVCDAVEHAHRRLVVHRDLKPGNVLVTSGDGKGGRSIAPEGAPTGGRPARQVKLLDFGIAKLLDVDQDAAPATRTSLRMMTPEYASPEQIRGQPVTTASDVYQLGLLLFELLTGHRPYMLHRRSAGEMERVICEQPPTRLSVAISREDSMVGPIANSTSRSGPLAANQEPSHRGHRAAPTSTVATLCQLRRTTPAKLRRRLRGDLENIVGKALSKEPERRYGSADRLAQDIRRHLTGLPVSARPDTWTYRSRKFVRRHAIGTATAAITITLIAGITGFYLVHLRNAYERAEAEASKARQVSEFLADIFQSADPLQAGGAELTTRELLDRGVKRVNQELATQPEIQAEMLAVLGRTYASLSLFDTAETLLHQALELQQNRLGRAHPSVAKALGDLGWLHYWQGRYAQALQLLNEAARMIESTLGDDAPELAEVLRYLGPAQRGLGDYETALATLERALAIQVRATGPESVPVARILNSIGILSNGMGAYDRAERAYSHALTIYEHAYGAESAAVGTLLVNLLTVKMNQGKLEGAEAMQRHALAMLESAYGSDHVSVATARFNLGILLNASGRSDEAVSILEATLEMLGRILAPGHPHIADTHTHLGIAHFSAGRLERARVSFLHSAAMTSAVPEGEQTRIAQVLALTWLGRTEAELGNLEAADRHLTRALKLWRGLSEPVLRFELGPPLRYLSHWLAGQQRCAEAEQLSRQAQYIPDTWRSSAKLRTRETEQAVAKCFELAAHG